MNVTRLWRIAPAILLLQATPVLTQGQNVPEFFVGVGGNYVRAVGGWGVGGELSAHLSIPTTVLGATPVLGMRARLARLESPSAFGSDAFLVGIGVHVGAEWSLRNRLLRMHVSVPLELVHAGWDNGLLICTMPLDATECDPSSDTAPAIGIGVGADVRLAKWLDLSLGVTRQWGNFDLRHSNILWSSAFGFTFALGSLR